MGEFSADSTLKRINEADTKNMIPGLRDFFIGCTGRNHRDSTALGDGRSLKRTTRGHFTQKSHDFVTGDQLSHSRGSFTWFGLIVLGDHSEGLSQDATRSIDLFKSKLFTANRALPPASLRSGQRSELPDRNPSLLLLRTR